MMDKVAKYISKSYPMTRKQITNALNAAFPILLNSESYGQLCKKSSFTHKIKDDFY